jgi:hypothetical protein
LGRDGNVDVHDCDCARSVDQHVSRGVVIDCFDDLSSGSPTEDHITYNGATRW